VSAAANTRRVPIIPTVIVAAAVAVMVALGVWQLGRADEKAALIARYEAAMSSASQVAWPTSPSDYEASLFSRATVNCTQVRGIDSIAGRSASGVAGWALVARCAFDGQGTADVAIGWSRDPNPPEWAGGEVSGLIAPYGDVVKLVADEGQAGLEPLAKPDPSDLPNNHLAYAGQWFFFALTALVIYWLALRRRWREQG
jgi:surfeit locus 1 family protein